MTTAIGSQAIATTFPVSRSSSAPNQDDTRVSDSVALGQNVPGLPKRPNFAAANAAPDLQREAQRKEAPHHLPMWMSGVAIGLAGLTLAGCTGKTSAPVAPPTPLTEQAKAAQTQLGQTFSAIEEQMKTMSSGGNGQQQSEQITRKLMDAVRQYSQASGRKADDVMQDLKGFMTDHPAVTVTALFALGTAGGVGLEKLGLSDGISQGVHHVYEQVQAHPFLATGVALAVAGGTAYVIYEVVHTEGDVPAKPTNPQAAQLESTFNKLDEQIQKDPNLDGASVHRTLFDSIQEYQKKTNETWEQVSQDVKAFAYEHPLVAATIITTAGIGTGVALEKAGVPDKVAGMIGTALQGGRDGAVRVGQLIKDHPVVAGAVAVGVATGVGYLVYQAHQAQTPAAATPTP